MAVERKRSTRRSVRHRVAVPSAHDQSMRSRTSKCKSCCKKFTAFLFSHVGLCALLVGYAIGGAFVFRALEAPHEVEKASQVSQMRNETVKKLWNITYATNILFKDNWTELVGMEIKNFQTKLIEAIKDGYDGKDSENHQWSFSGAFLFSLTVISTIGYGNISPRTEWGKVMTILYAIIGIPLMLLYLTNIGDILAKAFRYVYGRLCTCKSDDAIARDRRIRSLQMRHHNTLHRTLSAVPTPTPTPTPTTPIYQQPTPPQVHSLPTSPLSLYQSPFAPKIPVQNPSLKSSGSYHGSGIIDPNLQMESSNLVHPSSPEFNIINEKAMKEQVRVHVPITLCLAILASYVCGGGILFSLWEGWDYLDGSYFCFVTLSTIGFGDLVPGSSVVGDTGSQEKLVICSLYLLTGMALLGMCFNLMQDKVVHKVRNCGRKIGCIRDSDEFDENFDDDLIHQRQVVINFGLLGNIKRHDILSEVIHSFLCNATQWHAINTEIKCNPNPKPDGYCLVLASIRDEFLMRPSRECHFWDQNPDIVGGMDYEEGRQGGTWLAMHRNGKIAALLNVLKPLDQAVECEKTRGFLTVDYLNNNFDGPTYLRKISSQDLNQFNGFIIVTIDVDQTNHRITTAYLTNLEKQSGPTVAEEGIFTFGNSLPGRPWKKVNNAKRMFKKILLKTPSIKQKDFLVENLFKMMLNNKEYFPDDQLLKDGNGLNEKYLRKLSSLYVKMPDILFGSRTHTVILVDSKGNVDYIEKTMQEPTVKEFKHNNTWINTRLRFNLNGHHHPATIIPVSRL